MSQRTDCRCNYKTRLGPLSLPLVPYPLVLFLSRNLGGDSSSCYCYQAKVKSTPSSWPKTWSSTKILSKNKHHIKDRIITSTKTETSWGWARVKLKVIVKVVGEIWGGRDNQSWTETTFAVGWFGGWRIGE